MLKILVCVDPGSLFAFVLFFLISCFDSKFLPGGKVSAPPAPGIKRRHNQMPHWSLCSPIESLAGLAGGFQHLEQFHHKMDLKMDTISCRWYMTWSPLSPEVCTVSYVCTALYCHWWVLQWHRSEWQDSMWRWHWCVRSAHSVGVIPSGSWLKRRCCSPDGLAIATWLAGGPATPHHLAKKPKYIYFTFNLAPWFLEVK